MRACRDFATAFLALVAASTAAAPPMLQPEAGSGFGVEVLFTVGETIDGYRPPGVLDGTAAFALDAETLRLFVNHELEASAGYPYALANGTRLLGARVSFFDVDTRTRRVRAAGLAYAAVVDRAGRDVRAATQVSERPDGPAGAGFDSFCSASGYLRGDAGFVDDIFFTHEEVSAREGTHPHGGSVWALDVRGGALWALPELGRGSWENVAAIATPDSAAADGHVALLLADDVEFGAAPLYLWVGRKQPGGNFIERNGLARGQLWAWVADDGVRTPEDWRGSGSERRGRFVALVNREPARAGTPGYDAMGYTDDTTLRAQAAKLGAFLFSRPEDLAANPVDGSEVAFASTGHGELFPADDWGGLYLVRTRFGRGANGGLQPAADIRLLYDADETGDRGIRSPDNLAWAADGALYLQEDDATKRAAFGGVSGREASVWRLDPRSSGAPLRVAAIDRGAVPQGATDARSDDIGEWESSGVLDLSRALGAWPRELVLLATVQAHSVKDGPIGGRDLLVQGGQLLLLTRPGPQP